MSCTQTGVNHSLHYGARWPSGLVRCIGDRVVLGSNPAAATSLRNFGNSVYPALPVSFGGDTKSRRSLLSGVYAKGSNISHQSALEMRDLSWTPRPLEKDNSKNNPVYNTQSLSAHSIIYIHIHTYVHTLLHSIQLIQIHMRSTYDTDVLLWLPCRLNAPGSYCIT